MKKFIFTLQKFPNFVEELEADYQLLNEDESYTIREETAMAIVLKIL